MKGEYVDAKNAHTRHQHHHHHNNNNNNMFSKLHHSHSQHQQQQQHQHQQHAHSHPHQFHPFAANPFQVTSRECQTSDDNADDTATTPSAGQKRPSSSEPHAAPPTSGDGATIEVVRRPRGRPPGSKNKPKPPVIITRDTEPAMSPYILEVPGGNDVVEAIARFCRRKNMGLCVLTGSGTVANVTLRQPSTTPGATVTFHGRFDILSVAATFLPQPSPPATAPAMPAGFTISLAGPQGQIVGGIVAGALVAAGTVYVVAASFNNPSYHRLPPADEDGRGVAVAAGGSGGEGQSPAVSGGGESAGHAQTGEGSGGMAMYGCHVAPSEVIWAPTARQPPPY